jgi:hypothetical protein
MVLRNIVPTLVAIGVSDIGEAEFKEKKGTIGALTERSIAGSPKTSILKNQLKQIIATPTAIAAKK